MERFIQLMARREKLIELNKKYHYTQGYKIDKYLNCIWTNPELNSGFVHNLLSLNYDKSYSIYKIS